MGNIIQYLMKNGKYSLKEKPFNQVDNLILCQLAYLKFDGMVPEIGRRRKGATIMDVFTHKDRELLFQDERYEENNRALFEAASFSKRFQKMSMNYYVNIRDNEQQIQFSAITFFLEDGTIYVAYRGTDESIVGWKEDFNMSYKSPVPSQILSVRYLNRVGKRIPATFIVGGHSKGGNLAVYGAMKCSEDIKERIAKVFNNDGPGFLSEIIDKAGYESIEKKISRIVPQASLVGMLLQQKGEYEVVASEAKNVMMQHDPYSWEIEDGDFVRVDGIKEKNIRFNERLNGWVNSLDDQQREAFVETLYQVVSVTEAESLIELSDEWKDNAIKIINAFKDVDGETKKILVGVIRAWFQARKKKKPGRSKRAKEKRGLLRTARNDEV